MVTTLVTTCFLLLVLIEDALKVVVALVCVTLFSVVNAIVDRAVDSLMVMPSVPSGVVVQEEDQAQRALKFATPSRMEPVTVVIYAGLPMKSATFRKVEMKSRLAMHLLKDSVSMEPLANFLMKFQTLAFLQLLP